MEKRHLINNQKLDRLWDALSWLDTFNPEDTATMEQRFNFNLYHREIYDNKTYDPL